MSGFLASDATMQLSKQLTTHANTAVTAGWLSGFLPCIASLLRCHICYAATCAAFSLPASSSRDSFLAILAETLLEIVRQHSINFNFSRSPRPTAVFHRRCCHFAVCCTQCGSQANTARPEYAEYSGLSPGPAVLTETSGRSLAMQDSLGDSVRIIDRIKQVREQAAASL